MRILLKIVAYLVIALGAWLTLAGVAAIYSMRPSPPAITCLPGIAVLVSGVIMWIWLELTGPTRDR